MSDRSTYTIIVLMTTGVQKVWEHLDNYGVLKTLNENKTILTKETYADGWIIARSGTLLSRTELADYFEWVVPTEGNWERA
jgi:hypothetical protein